MRRDVRLRDGYCSLFALIANCLKLQKLPTIETIDAMTSPQSDEANFLLMGGNVLYVLQYLLAESEALEIACYGIICDDGWVSLPKCQNDNNYTLVKSVLLNFI
jgi:hypothetical protein